MCGSYLQCAEQITEEDHLKATAFFFFHSNLDLHEGTWTQLVKLQLFLSVSPLWLRTMAAGDPPPLPSRLLYSGFSLKSEWDKKKRKKEKEEPEQNSFRSLFRGSFFWSPVYSERGISWAFRVSGSTTASVVHFRSALERLKTLPDHIIFKKRRKKKSRSEALSGETRGRRWELLPLRTNA